MKLQGVTIAGTGSYAPEKILTNDDLAKIVDTSDEWIRTRTGIRQRHIAAENEFTSDLATSAAREALETSGIDAQDIQLIIVATLTPDKTFPNTASLVQKNIDAPSATCFSIEAGCTGFVYGLEVASGMIGSGLYKNALVIGAEKLTSVVDWKDRTTCVLFGDGAGAAVLTAADSADNCYLGSDLGSDGNYHDILHVPAGGCSKPITQEILGTAETTLQMNGREVFKLAVNGMSNSAAKALEEAGMTIDDIDWVIPHQANMRIIAAVGKKLGVSDDKVYINVDRYGNTSAASVPIALNELVNSGELKRGQNILFVAFGGGLTWGANVVRY